MGEGEKEHGENFSYLGSAASRPGHAAEVAVVFPARRLRHGVVMPRTSCPRLTRESPHQLAVPHVSWRQPRTRNTALGGRPTAARIHRTARVNMCIQISPIESLLVGHVTAGRAALETGCMPTQLQSLRGADSRCCRTHWKEETVRPQRCSSGSERWRPENRYHGEIRGRRRPTEVATMSRAEALREKP